MITCDDCIHWEERSNGRDEHRRWGRCCFNPPVVVYVHKLEETRTIWPETSPDASCSKGDDGTSEVRAILGIPEDQGRH